MELIKAKRVKLKGVALKKLNDSIHARDGDSCIICGQHVERGIKFHHEPQGAMKSDEIQKGVTLCNECHYKRHHTSLAGTYKTKCQDYLEELYGGDND